MFLENLRVNYPKLISHMEADGYSDDFIARMQRMVGIILADSQTMGWKSYYDVFRYYETNLNSHDSIVKKHTVIGAIMEFDLNGKYPDRKHSRLTQKNAYTRLSPEFQMLIDRYITAARDNGKKESSIKMESSNASSFLLRIQETGITRLSDVTEEIVIPLFVPPMGKPQMNSTQRKCIANVIRANIPFDPYSCRKALAAIPSVRRKTKNVQYLNDREGQAILLALDDMRNSLTLRDRAIGKLAYFTGMRSSDMAALDLSSIDWNRDLIVIKQQKTGTPLDMPLRAPVGNAIFDYLVSERPPVKCPALFITKNKPYRRLCDIWNVSAVILTEAGIRQIKGDRKGFHIFRHHLTTTLLANDVSQAVITEALGHAAPESLESYLSADISHLKECALSIVRFPIEEVLANA